MGLAQAAGPAILAIPARAFCTVIRGTPLLVQLWLLYYGLGSLFPQYPWIRGSELWPYLRQAWPYAVLALTLSYAGYEGEVMRGAFASVPKGQLEAARAFGMRRFTIFRRIWLPQAIHRALPTLAGEAVLQLKSTPLVATITVVDLYSVASRVRQDTFLTYEPLLAACSGLCGYHGHNRVPVPALGKIDPVETRIKDLCCGANCSDLCRKCLMRAVEQMRIVWAKGTPRKDEKMGFMFSPGVLPASIIYFQLRCEDER